MNKKGQLYLFVAILLLTYAFAVSRPTSTPGEPIGTFQDLHRNFMTDGPHVINNALHNQANVSAEFAAYSDNFYNYARTRDPNFRYAYLLSEPGRLVIGNTFDGPISISSGNQSLNIAGNSILVTQVSGETILTVAGIPYTFSIPDDQYDLKALFRKEDADEIRIYAAQ